MFTRIYKIIFLNLILSFCLGVAVAANLTHIIIIDGGSTSSKLYLFSYDKGRSYPELFLQKKITKKPPVTDASVVAQPQVYFNALLRDLMAAYPLSAEQRAQTPIYFMATAGVRSLPVAQQKEVIKKVRIGLIASMQKQGYKIPTHVENNMRIISGSEEGLFGWLATQYWSGALKQNPLTPNNTTAILEMGGSSTQIAFLSAIMPHEHGQPYTQAGEVYHPYVYSYANFGTNASISAMMDLFKQQGGDFGACFPPNSNYPLTSSIVRGTGDFAKCAEFIKAAIYTKEICTDCSKMGVYQPAFPVERAILTSGYVFAFNVLDLAHQWVALERVAQSGHTFCAKPWEQLKAEYPNEAPNYLITYCFNAAWMDSLFHGYGLSDGAQLLATDAINNVRDSTDWATGAVWYLLNEQ